MEPGNRTSWRSFACCAAWRAVSFRPTQASRVAPMQSCTSAGRSPRSWSYAFELKPTSEDRFIFEQEQTFFHDTTHFPEPYNDESWSGHSEARVSESTSKIAGYVRRHLD